MHFSDQHEYDGVAVSDGWHGFAPDAAVFPQCRSSELSLHLVCRILCLRQPHAGLFLPHEFGDRLSDYRIFTHLFHRNRFVVQDL